MGTDFDATLAGLKKGLPPSAMNLIDFLSSGLWPAAERYARELGLGPFEQRECARRMVQAVIQQAHATGRRASMRDMARRPQQ